MNGSFLANASIALAVMALLALAELAVPLFARSERSRGRVFSNAGLSFLTLALNGVLTSAAGVLAVAFPLERAGLLAPLALPALPLALLTVVTLDLSTYLAHVSMHRIPWLWRVHRVHHSDPFLDVTTTLRQHPLEGLWRLLWILVPVWGLGLPMAGLLAYRLLSVIQAFFEHANLRVWRPLDRALSWLWVTPNMHKVHHSRARLQTDSNYGNLLSVFDRGFGTFRSSDEAFGVVYGLEDVDERRARSLPGLLSLPFLRAERALGPSGLAGREA